MQPVAIDETVVADVKKAAKDTCERVDNYVSRKIDLLDAARDKHINFVRSAMAQIAALDKRIEAFSSKNDEVELMNKKSIEEITLLEGEIEALKKQQEPFPGKLKELEDQSNKYLQMIESKKADLTKTEESIVKTIAPLRRLKTLYSKALGLVFENPLDNEFRVIFTNITRGPRDGSLLRECSFTVKLDGNQRYVLSECTPSLSGARSIVDQVNITNDFSRMIVDMRRLFKSSFVGKDGYSIPN